MSCQLKSKATIPDLNQVKKILWPEEEVEGPSIDLYFIRLLIDTTVRVVVRVFTKLETVFLTLLQDQAQLCLARYCSRSVAVYLKICHSLARSS